MNKAPTIRNQVKNIVEKLRDKDLTITASLWEISRSDTLNRFNKFKSAIINSGNDTECLVNGKKLIFCLNDLVNRTNYVASELAKQKISEVVQELSDFVNQKHKLSYE